MRKVLVIAGPTASGKTGFSLACASRFQGEIVSGDSIQVYRGLDIGSGKIRPQEMQGVKHHLIDVLDPGEPCSVAAFQAMVAKNKPWQEAAEMGTDEDVLITRREPRLDPMRDISYPDVLTTGVLHTNGIYEVQMRASRFNGPFLEGRLWQEPVQRIGIHKDDLLRALPYQAEDGFHLLSIFTGDHLSRADQKAYQELIKEGEAVGFGFSRMMTRS